MKPLSLLPAAFLVTLVAGLSDATAQRRFEGSREGPRGGSVSVEGGGVGRFRAGSVDAEGPRGGSYEAQGARVGRFRTGSVDAEGPRGGSYEAQGTQVGRYRQGSVEAQGPAGATYSASASRWSGYRTGYVYTGGVYRPANITVNSVYVAPVGVYAGFRVVTQPYYVSYPVYATYPVETAVQIELARRNFYKGPIDGQVGPGTQNAIRAYQAANQLAVTGTINQALLVSLGIAPA